MSSAYISSFMPSFYSISNFYIKNDGIIINLLFILGDGIIKI